MIFGVKTDHPDIPEISGLSKAANKHAGQTYRGNRENSIKKSFFFYVNDLPEITKIVATHPLRLNY